MSTRLIRDRTVLLLTATIDPGDTPFVARRDPPVRLRDYQQSLLAWLSCGAFDRVVMYENSGYDISSLQEIALRFPQRRVEFHSFQGNQFGSSKGKGYSEMLGISRVLRESELIRDSDRIAKCTGRLTVRNARALFRLIGAKEFDIMCTLRLNLSFASSRLFVASPTFFSDYLMPGGSIIDDAKGIYFEHALACATARAISERKHWLPFPIFPHIVGVSGTSNENQTFSATRRALHALLHRFENFSYARDG